MSHFAKAVIRCRVARIPTSRALPSGKTCAEVVLARAKRWQDSQGEWHTATLWIAAVGWGRMATRLLAADAFPVGTGVLVAGDMDVEEYRDANGQPHVRLRLTLTDLDRVSDPPARESAAQPSPEPA